MGTCASFLFAEKIKSVEEKTVSNFNNNFNN